LENDLQYIKKSIKSAKYPLQEVTNRIIEKQKHFLSSNINLDHIIIVKEIVNTTPYFCSLDKLFEKIIIRELNVTININNARDKYIMLKNKKIAIVNNIVKPYNELGIKLIVQHFLKSTSFFLNPLILLLLACILLTLLPYLIT
jgi:hypothetical protein